MVGSCISVSRFWFFILIVSSVDERVKQRINYDDWLNEKKRKEEIKLAVVKADKAAKKLEEEKKYVTSINFHLKAEV